MKINTKEINLLFHSEKSFVTKIKHIKFLVKGYSKSKISHKIP